MASGVWYTSCNPNLKVAFCCFLSIYQLPLDILPQFFKFFQEEVDSSEPHHWCRNVMASGQGFCDKSEQNPLLGGRNDVREMREVSEAQPRVVSLPCASWRWSQTPYQIPKSSRVVLYRGTDSAHRDFSLRYNRASWKVAARILSGQRCVLHCGPKTAAKRKKSKDKKDTQRCLHRVWWRSSSQHSQQIKYLKKKKKILLFSDTSSLLFPGFLMVTLCAS